MTVCRRECNQALKDYAFGYRLAAMNPSDAILKLRESGMSEQVIAAAVHTSQPTINRIRRGKVEPGYVLGSKLVAMATLLPAANGDDRAQASTG